MWLLDTTTLKIKEFFDSQRPPYAILSHTWEGDEVSFAELQEQPDVASRRAGFAKVARFCTLAAARGLRYGWVDSCCIDKRSSADLTEALNAMYSYYYDAAVCLVFLADVPGCARTRTAAAGRRAEQLAAVARSRWLTRGWTLQELIAPEKRVFLAADWSVVHDDEVDAALGNDIIKVIAATTGIKESVLYERELVSTICIAERMCWAAHRETTRSEDRAYSLVGIFSVSMPIIYGEGLAKAFRRLQERIIATNFDQSIFAWRALRENSGLLADSPTDFASTPPLRLRLPVDMRPSSVTNTGIFTRMLINFPRGAEEEVMTALSVEAQIDNEWLTLGVHLRPIPKLASLESWAGKAHVYRRVRCNMWAAIDPAFMWIQPVYDILVLENEQFSMAQRALENDLAIQTHFKLPLDTEDPGMVAFRDVVLIL